MSARLAWLVAMALVALVACDGPAPPAEDAGGSDSGEGMDGGAVDASDDGGSVEPCAVDEDCDDGVFCDGAEACMPGATDADERGCVEAAAGPCAEGEICDEDTSTCDMECADADRDGHGDVACGGDDCDDADENRYPGNVEVCDMAGHDEDCNTDTFGFLDADSDGSGSYVCCNVLEGGDLNCGDDCNDGDSTVNPRAGDGPPLYCDGIDNDCSDVADEGCPCTEGETQECGTEPQRMRIGICRPGTQVCSGGEFTDTCIGAVAAAEEICDGLDNDCDMTVDEAVLRTYYPDVDGDGFGATVGAPTMACSAPAGYASNATDCDDTIASVNPGATEVCNARDDNCTGGIDEGFIGNFYADADGDGFGNAAMATMACSPPAGYVRNATDCDDTNGSRNPATIEGCNGVDDNCNGMTDEGLLRTFYADADGDAWGVAGTTTMACTAPAGYSDRSGDCDDTRAAANPAGTEVCNGLDDNCAGGVDEGVLRTFYLDTDRDSFGLSTSTMTACTAPANHSDRGGDCNDTSASVNPSAAETCNGRDDNCDGATDTGCTCTDGATRDCGPTTETGECAFGTQTCLGGEWGGCVGAVLSTAESCNGRDDDCDGAIDNGTTVMPCYRDGDGDGYGTGGTTSQCRDAARMAFGFCPVGWVNNNTDCNDGVSAIRPGAAETCDGVDQDCDGMADDGATIACYGDADADGFGTGSAVQRCADPARTMFGMCPSGFTNVATDCNDGASTVRPGAPELCNDVDDDCDMTVDDGVGASPCHADADGDGYGTGPALTRCRDASRMAQGYCPVGYTNVSTDCNDGASSIRPGGTEVCNGLDDDCDGMADEMLTATGCYVDGDSDGYGTGTSSTQCRDGARMAYGYCPVGYTNAAGDCNDTNGTVRPGATEVCNGVDDDCDTTADDGTTASPCHVDSDGDGYGSGSALTRCRDASRMAQGYCPVGYTNVATDCNDANASVRPMATETCNDIDDDCDGMADEMLTVTGCYVDGDSDAYGTGTSSTQCRDAARTTYGYCPVGYTNASGDCNDTNGSVRPGATETCNGVDDDCDTTVDDGASASPCYSDADGDGYGAGSSSSQCRDASRMTYGYCPVGYSNVATDCNDGSSGVRPGGTETCNGVDDDCDGMTDELLTVTGCYADGDSDGYGTGTSSTQCRDAARMTYGYCPVGYTNVGTDCNDTNGSVRPGATETCNGVDDDCDTTVDDGATATPCYSDADGDGYGTGSSSSQCRDASRMAFGYCPVGYSNVATDCNDGNSSVRPGGTETCNGLDDNCNSMTDEMLTVTGCYVDGDSDGYGGGTSSTQCRDAARMTYGYCPVGYTNASGDCNDTNSSVKPSATELCNGVDDDCDTTVDDGVTASPCHTDSDGDGYGTGAPSTRCRDASRMTYGYCPVGYTSTATDCNDSNSSVRPMGTESCNGIDDDCDGTTDETLTVTGCYVDPDSDGFGAGPATTQCRDAARMAAGYCPIGYTNTAGDCNNSVATIRPGGTESCNGVDDDCDTTVDDGVLITYYRDADNDGYGVTGTTATGCTAPTGYVASSGDCDDTRTNVHPNAPEVCNSIDENCVSGTSDEPTSRFYLDADSDGYGTATIYMDRCEQPVGHTLLSGDCNDGNSSVRPTATEICNGVDDDCDMTTDDGAAAQCAGAYPFATSVATWTCSAGSCGTSCATGYANCDGNPINGCEVNLATDATHCGSCTTVCGTGALCESSTCDEIVDIFAGSYNACVLWDSRRLACWGEGDGGQLSRDLLQDENRPVHIDDLAAIRTDTGRPVLALSRGSAASGHLLAVTGDSGSNLLYGWAYNNHGQLGDGTFVSPRIAPSFASAAGTDEVAAGQSHSCLRRGTSVYCWGWDAWGQLGDGTAGPSDTNTIPGVALSLGGASAAQITAGAEFSCARTTAGGVRCWGRGGYGALGNGLGTDSATSVAVTGLPASPVTVTQVEAGYNHACALLSTGAVYCWGSNSWGQIGDGTTTQRNSATAVNVASPRPTTYSDIATGREFTCGVASNAANLGQVWCWGWNNTGQLGLGSTDAIAHPLAVRAGASMPAVSSVVAGDNFACAISTEPRPRVFCWGNNASGQLGRGHFTTPQPTPSVVVNVY